MNSSQPAPTTLSLIPHAQPVSLPRILYGIAFGFAYMIYYDMVFWERRFGRKNPQSDMVGPVNLPVMPSKQIAPGKANLASLDLIKASPAIFLLYGTVKDASGLPIKAELQIWQADCDGAYYLRSDELRGKLQTDSAERFQILTVAPKPYPGRPGHIHFHVTPTGPDSDKYSRGITTQLYFANGNSPEALKSDMLNLLRAPRTGNVLKARLTHPADEESFTSFMDLPTAAQGEDPERDVLVDEWNRLLHGVGGPSVSIVASFDFVL